MAELQTPQNPQVLSPEPELHLLLTNQTLDEPLWKSLFRNVDEFFFPKKLPPLVLTSKPVAVRDIWGFYNYKGQSAAGLDSHPCAGDCFDYCGDLSGTKRAVDVAKPKETVVLIAPDDVPMLPPSKTRSGGGGGGGDRDKLAGIGRAVCRSNRCSSSRRRWRWCAIPTRSCRWNRRSWFRPILRFRNRTFPTWAIPCRTCRLCLRMEPDLAAASAPAAEAASVRVRALESARVRAVALAVGSSTWAAVFLLRR
jgi:hypothetical protein